MKQTLLICTVAAALPAFAQADPAADLAAAAKTLAAAKNYSWSSSTAFGDREAGVTTGKTGSGGFTLASYPGRDNSTFDVLTRNGKVAFKTDDGWQLADPDAQGDENRRFRFLARMAANSESPTARVAELVAKAGDLKLEEGTYTGTLGEEAARELMSWRGRGRGQDGQDRQPPAINGATGTVKFMVKDGVLTKYELTLGGKMTFNDQERDISRTTTVEFTNVGSTSFDIAEEAAGLLANAPAE